MYPARQALWQVPFSIGAETSRLTGSFVLLPHISAGRTDSASTSAPNQACVAGLVHRNIAGTKRKRYRRRVNACYLTPDIERCTEVQALVNWGFLGGNLFALKAHRNFAPKSTFAYFCLMIKVGPAERVAWGKNSTGRCDGSGLCCVQVSIRSTCARPRWPCWRLR